MPLPILPPSFYDREAVQVARELLGKRLVREVAGVQISGYICETEAYIGSEDLACHARAGKTARTAVMFGPPGRAYVYFTYGMHWCFNVVTGSEGFAAAVLVRAIFADEGLDFISERRAGVKRRNWTDGPAKLTKALAIDKAQNGTDLTHTADGLWIEEGIQVPESEIRVSARIGIDGVPEPWRSKPWRFWFSDDLLKSVP